MRLSDFIEGVGRPVAYYPGLRRITGSTTATILLCQLSYWTGKQADPGGWIFKTSEQLEAETGLSYEEQRTARKALIKAGLVEERYARLTHRMYFRVLLDAINDAWDAHSQLPNKAKPSSRNGDCPDGEMGNAHIDSTENTTETTQENHARANARVAPTPPAVKVFRSETQRYPAKSWHQQIAEIVGEAEIDLQFWRQVCHAYVGLGWSPVNVANMLDFYKRREIPPGNGRYKGKEGKGEPAGYRAIKDWLAQEEQREA